MYTNWSPKLSYDDHICSFQWAESCLMQQKRGSAQWWNVQTLSLEAFRNPSSHFIDTQSQSDTWPLSCLTTITGIHCLYSASTMHCARRFHPLWLSLLLHMQIYAQTKRLTTCYIPCWVFSKGWEKSAIAVLVQFNLIYCHHFTGNHEWYARVEDMLSKSL